jgi:glutamate dehydrogenase/leucine dehydrogenase
VPAGDIGVGGREVGYLFGQYKRLKNEFTGVLTGKGINFGGSLIRPEATGYGSVYFSEEMLKTKGETLKGKVCVVSGSGNVAQFTVEKLIEKEAKVISVSDSKGFIHDPDGITTEKLEYIMDLKNNRRGRIKEYAAHYNVQYYEGQKPWGLKCDCAYPSATQNEISEEDAKKLVENGCYVVSEGANMPSTPEAVTVFQDAKILFAPGKAANAGGVSVSGLEMTQNSLRLSWTREEVDTRLQNIMKDIHSQCEKYGTQKDGYIDYVKGANIAGFVKVADAMIAQGHV